MKLLITIILCLAALVTAAKPRKHMALTDDLVAYWGFEQDPAVFRIHDQSGNGNHIVPTTTTSAIQVDGKVNKAVETAGAAALTLSGNNSGISHQGNPFTVALWLKPLAVGASIPIVGEPDGEWLVQMEQSGGNFYLRVRIDPGSADATIDLVDVPVAIGEWHFLAFGWYINNGNYAWATIDLSDRVRVAATTFPSSVRIPSWWAPVVYDEMAIWRRNVTAQELRQLYNHGDGLTFEDFAEQPACPTIECCN